MKRSLLVLLVLLLAATGVVAQDDDTGGDDDVTDSQFAGSPDLAIPPFPDDLEWVNVDEPLTVESLQGKIVILDFWTYGCINCIHMIPVLEQLKETYPDELVVIGVHSAKFSNEGETENIRQIVQRYDIEHPVINDSDMRVWRIYGANAWPTFVVVDPRGNVLAAQAGEIPFDAFNQLVGGMVDYWDAQGELNREPLEIAPEGEGEPARLLDFPGKVLVDAEGGRLFIADTGHDRIVIADLETFEVLDVIGTGQDGFNDGSFEEATFYQPHGMALVDNVLYIADTKNHAVRAADLDARTVDVVAGTGERGTGPIPFGSTIREPRAFQLRSPWDVEPGPNNTLYIAHAGTHQILALDLESRALTPAVGNGREAARNATLATSELAQPSGLYYTDGLLYFADSESSTIRVADFNNDAVMTISGTLEDNLFDYGDIDGVVGTSRLQHALGVDGAPDGLIYVADTYNSRIKVVDPTMTTQTLFGLGGNGGFADGGPEDARFDEPGGLDYHAGKLYVADTNNHAIRVIDLESQTVSTVSFPNPEALQIEERLTIIGGGTEPDNSMVTLDVQALGTGEGGLIIRAELPEGYKLNDIARSYAKLSTEGDAVIVTDNSERLFFGETDVRVPLALSEGEGRVIAEVEIFYCEAVNETLCFVDEFMIEVPLTVDPANDATEVTVPREIVPPDTTGLGDI